jgi:hypothetical protein
MSSLHRLPLRDVEDLSAYLDGELPAGRAARLEARLKAEPALAQALADLRATAQALGSLPALRPPRSLLLRPGIVRPRQPFAWAFPTLRLATALSAVAFAVVTGFNAFGRGLAFGPMASAPAPEAIGALEAPAAADVSPTEPDEPMALAAPAPAEPAPSATAEAESALRAAEAGTPDGMGGGLEVAPVEEAPALVGAAPEAAIAPGEVTSQAAEPEVSATVAPRLPPVALPAALAALTLVLGVLTLWTRPRTR